MKQRVFVFSVFYCQAVCSEFVAIAMDDDLDRGSRDGDETAEEESEEEDR